MASASRKLSSISALQMPSTSSAMESLVDGEMEAVREVFIAVLELVADSI